jgi:hypothetical protein
VLSLPNCFAFGTSPSNTPSITAILPSSGTFDGNTRVTIIGSGFSTGGVQVFFGTVEATVISTTFNQIVALSPAGPPGNGAEVPVGVTVKNINSGIVSGAVTFTYRPALKLNSIAPNEEPADGPFTPVTIFGAGFQAPVAVVLAGRPAVVSSVSATEIVVLPTSLLVTDCSDTPGQVSVTNINSGDTVTGLSWLYLVKTFAPALQFSQPNAGDVFANPGLTVTLFGQSLSRVTKVTVGSRAANFTILSDSQISVVIPDDLAVAPTCPPGTGGGTETNIETVDITVTSITGCTSVLSQAFTYQRQCIAPTPTAASVGQ